ncbi:hypothetical protein BHE74_00037416 [Ensete ventricosum]|nr:hypothetical protein BHE74_00037416 [Ensete ventricosum]
MTRRVQRYEVEAYGSYRTGPSTESSPLPACISWSLSCSIGIWGSSRPLPMEGLSNRHVCGPFGSFDFGLSLYLTATSRKEGTLLPTEQRKRSTDSSGTRNS